jgi:hypothetical protein
MPLHSEWTVCGEATGYAVQPQAIIDRFVMHFWHIVYSTALSLLKAIYKSHRTEPADAIAEPQNISPKNFGSNVSGQPHMQSGP